MTFGAKLGPYLAQPDIRGPSTIVRDLRRLKISDILISFVSLLRYRAPKCLVLDNCGDFSREADRDRWLPSNVVEISGHRLNRSRSELFVQVSLDNSDGCFVAE